MNNRKILTAITGGVDTLGIAISASDINNILNIVLLILSIVGIVVTLVFNIIDHIKNKEYNKLGDDIKSATEEIKQIQSSQEESKND